MDVGSGKFKAGLRRKSMVSILESRIREVILASIVVVEWLYMGEVPELRKRQERLQQGDKDHCQPHVNHDVVH